MRSLRLIIAACALAAAAGDAPIAGDWMGSLDAGGKTLRITLHLKHEAARWSGTSTAPIREPAERRQGCAGGSRAESPRH
jgi:hypothetical protein